MNYGEGLMDKQSKNKLISVDAGCGVNKKGNIGLDIVITDAFDILCDLEQIPLKDNSADSIITEHVIEHITNPYNVIREFRRILKTGGVIHIGVPHAFTTGAYSIDHKHYFTLRSLDYVINPDLAKYYSGIQFKLKYRTLRFSGRFTKWLNPFVRINPEIFERLLKMSPLEFDIVYVLEK
jgi:ubiquinone/menaquinone biosynthesis C-methylase UbiE